MEIRLGDKVQVVYPTSVFRDDIGTVKRIDPSKRCLTIEILVFDRPTQFELDFDTATHILKRIKD